MDAIRFLPRAALGKLISALHDAGYRVIGPREELGQGGLVYREIGSQDDLPQGLVAEQQPGSYRLRPGGTGRHFSWANTASAVKPFVFSPRERLWRVMRKEGRVHFEAIATPALKTAILGVRACDLAALALQDAHFMQGRYTDVYYRARREKLLLIAVNCSHAAATCFCASTGDGPEVSTGYDLLLDELDDGFLVRVGTSKGAMMLSDLRAEPATEHQIAQACVQTEQCRTQQRTLPAASHLAKLTTQLEHPQWAKVAERCLACGNCTAVCPTCFCHREFESPALDGQNSEHWRDADSCFSEDHSYLVGEVVRAETRSRYRQWMTHKLATWIEQYGRPGCVGCGRCITWCPVGIDFVAEANQVLADEEHE